MARAGTENPATRRERGFEPASGLLRGQIRAAGEARGFALPRLLTHWTEIAGEDLAAITRPVRMSWGREGMGATLVLLVRAAEAPVVQMQLPRLKDRVNAAHGYNAIARIQLTQTAATGFAEGQAEFHPAPPALPPAPDPAIVAEASRQVAPIHDASLRQALERLAGNILSRKTKKEG